MRPRAPLQRLGIVIAVCGLLLALVVAWGHPWPFDEFLRVLALGSSRTAGRVAGSLLWIGLGLWLGYPLLIRVAGWIRNG